MQIPVILGTWGWEGRQENCNVGPVSRKEVKEMGKKKKKLMVGESSVYHHMGEGVKKPGHCLFSLVSSRTCGRGRNTAVPSFGEQQGKAVSLQPKGSLSDRCGVKY